MSKKRVVITGMGAITPIGNNLKEYNQSLFDGISGCKSITRFDASKFKTKFACELKNYDPLNYFDKKESRKMDAFAQYGLIVAEEALQDSGIDLNKIDKNKFGVIWGSGVGGIETFQNEIINFSENNRNPRFNPFFIPKLITDICPGLISIKYGLKGPNFATVSACASASNAIIDSYNYIKLGISDIIITGGSEAAVNEAGVGGFNALKALSERNDSPETASRPFDKERDGFVLGEGGGGLILENYDHAIKRNAKIYAEIIGFGMSSDAHHITAPHPDGEGARLAMNNAINNANIKKEEIDYINVHGTSTSLGDKSEIFAIENVFNEHAYNINISSTKSMTGHLLGAAPALEAALSVMAIMRAVIPPTINLEDPDPECDLDYTPFLPRRGRIKVSISNSLGFGGHSAVLVFRETDDA